MYIITFLVFFLGMHQHILRSELFYLKCEIKNLVPRIRMPLCFSENEYLWHTSFSHLWGKRGFGLCKHLLTRKTSHDFVIIFLRLRKRWINNSPGTKFSPEIIPSFHSEWHIFLISILFRAFEFLSTDVDCSLRDVMVGLHFVSSLSRTQMLHET